MTKKCKKAKKTKKISGNKRNWNEASLNQRTKNVKQLNDTQKKMAKNLIPGGKHHIITCKTPSNQIEPKPSRTENKQKLHNEMPETERKYFPEPSLGEVSGNAVEDYLEKLSKNRSKNYINVINENLECKHSKNEFIFVCIAKRSEIFT